MVLLCTATCATIPHMNRIRSYCNIAGCLAKTALQLTGTAPDAQAFPAGPYDCFWTEVPQTET